MRSLFHAAIRPFLRAWVLSSSGSWRGLPVPAGQPSVHTAGSDANRILLIGNGIAVGYGVLTHDLGLAGQLARRLSTVTARGISVHVRAAPTMTTTTAVRQLAGADVAKYDAIVSTLGGIEAVGLMPARLWGVAIESMIVSLLDRAPTTALFFIETPAPKTMVRMPWLYDKAVSAHTQRLNKITRELCARYPNATFVDFEPSSTRVVDTITSHHYHQWAQLIAEPIAAGLDRHRDPDQGVPVDEDARLAALNEMGLEETAVDIELNQIVATTRDLFGASGAALNAINRTRQWGLAAVGLSRDSVPRGRSVCANTIASGEFFVVEDTDNDDSYAWSDWVVAEGRVRFYAGYPIEAPNGQRIGTLCVVDTKPRKFTSTDRALLRELAMHAQSVLWNNHRTALAS